MKTAEGMNEKKMEIYRVSDMALTTVLSLFLPFDGIDRSNPRRVQFLFIKTPKLEALVNRYWRGKLRIEPQKLFNQLKIIKARLYSEN
ncbi:MAG: DUF5659 domain-containing protein [Candidatus Ratteibacteria bacterium]|jgi:hypothetical protein